MKRHTFSKIGICLVVGSSLLSPTLPAFAADGDYTLPDGINFQPIQYMDELKNQVDNNYDALNTQGTTTLPATYDLRSEGLSTSVKNQAPLNDCFAFGALASMESNVLKQTGKTSGADEPNYSVKQLAYFDKHQRPSTLDQAGEGIVRTANIGTDLDFASSYESIGQLSNAEGPVATADVPHLDDKGGLDNKALWTVDEKWRDQSLAPLINSEVLASPANWTSGTYQTDYSAIENAKQLLMENGALSIYLAVNTSSDIGELKKCWNPKTGAYYFKDGTSSNHAVTLIGWDDNYPKENFVEGYQPTKNGAFLIKNSWGDSPDNGSYMNRIPDGNGGYTYGYFWVSYEDPTLDTPMSYEADAEADDFDHINQYDYLNVRSGLSASPGLASQLLQELDAKVSTSPTVANTFRANTAQTLTRTSAYTIAPNATIKTQVYLNSPEGKPTEGILVNETTTTFDHAGFHSIDLSSVVDLHPDDTYTITQSQSYADSSKNIFAPIEIGFNSETLVTEAVVNKGESYVETADGWVDISTFPAYEQEGENAPVKSFKMGNAMIKAYTNDREAQAWDAVIDQIDALGDITSLKQEAAVKAARDAYNALSAADQAKVYNKDVLEAAEAKIDELKKAQPTTSVAPSTTANPSTTAAPSTTTTDGKATTKDNAKTGLIEDVAGPVTAAVALSAIAIITALNWRKRK